MSRITIRRAIQNLPSKRLVVTKRGIGSFIATPPRSQRPNALTSSVADMDAHGLNTTTGVLVVEEITAPAHVLAALELPVGAKILHTNLAQLAARSSQLTACASRRKRISFHPDHMTAQTRPMARL